MVTKAEEDIYWRNDWMQRVSLYIKTVALKGDESKVHACYSKA